MRIAKGKKILVSVLCFLLALGFIAPSAIARPLDEPPVEPIAELRERSHQLEFLRILLFEVDLSISSNGLSTSFSRVRLANLSDTATLTMELQRQNGNSWSRVNSWSTNGSVSVSIARNWNVPSGNSYRVMATAQVFNSSGRLVETVIAHSGTVQF